MVHEFGPIKSYEDIQDVQEASPGLVFISDSVLYTRCSDPKCSALHVLMRSAPGAPWDHGVTFTTSMLRNMLEIAEMIEAGKKQ